MGIIYIISFPKLGYQIEPGYPCMGSLSPEITQDFNEAETAIIHESIRQMAIYTSDSLMYPIKRIYIALII